MELAWNDIAIHTNEYEADKLLLGWRWLVDDSFSVILPTVLGDLFLERKDGTIWLLHACAGQLEQVCTSYDNFNAFLRDPQRLRDWFATDLIADLLASGLRRKPGECFSPMLPPVIGGKIEPANFHSCPLLAHHALLGPLHQKVSQLPPGTPISGIDIEWT